MKRAVLKITNRHNPKFFCYPWLNSPKEEPVDLSLGRIKEIIDEEYKRMFDEIEITGELFLHPRLKEIINFLTKAAKFVWLEAGEENLSKHAEIIKKDKIGLKFYLAGLTAKENDVLMGVGSFSRIEKNIDFALKQGKPIHVDFLVHQKNYKTLPKVISFAESKKIVLNFQELMPLGDAANKKELILKGESLIDFWRAIVNWKQRGFRFSAFSNFLVNHRQCRFGRVIVFNEKGELQKCLFDQYFISAKQKNSLQSVRCADCFSWSGEFDLSGDSISKKKKPKETTLSMVAKAYYEKEDCPPSVKIGESLRISQKEDPAAVAEIVENFNLVKRMAGVNLEWFSNYVKPEEELNLIITDRTELRHIFYSTKSAKINPSFPVVRNFIEEAGFRGVLRVVISGGDILLFKEIKKLIDFLDQADIQPVFSLDGWNFAKHQKALIKVKGASFGFEVYGATAAVHDQHVGREGSFDKIMEAMEFLIDQERPVGLNYILTQKNGDELEQMINFASMLELSFFNLIPVEDKFIKVKKGYANSPKTIKNAEKYLKESLAREGSNLRCALVRLPKAV